MYTLAEIAITNMKNEIKTKKTFADAVMANEKKRLTKKTKKVEEPYLKSIPLNGDFNMCLGGHFPEEADSEDTVNMVKESKKLIGEEFEDGIKDIPTSVVILTVVILAVVIAMVNYNVTPFLEANDIFLMCK